MPSLPSTIRSRLSVLRARRRAKELTAEPEQVRLARQTVSRVLRACYRPVPALPQPERRRLLARGMTVAAAATVPAMVLSPAAHAALAAAPLSPALLSSDVAGRYPGDGTHRPLTRNERFFNVADGTYAYVDATGAQRRLDLGALKTPQFFDAAGAGGDDTEGLRRFFASGSGYIKPTAAGYTVKGTLSIPSNSDFVGPQSAVIRLALPVGSPAIPLVETARWSEGGENITLVGGVTLDHQGERLTNPRGDRSWVAVGSILILRSAYTTISVTLKNSWDDGILVSDYDWRTNTYAADAAPPGIVIRDGFSFNCGCGNHSVIDTPGGAGRNGGAIDVADARGFIVSNWYDHGSSSAVGTDTGGTAFGVVSACIAIETRGDRAFPLNGSGNSFVCQTNGVTFTDCVSFFPARSAFWVAGTPTRDTFVEKAGDGTCLSSCYGFFAGTNTFWICAPRVALASCNAYAPSRSAKGVYDGFRVEATFEDIANVTLSGCSATSLTRAGNVDDGYMRYEYAESPRFVGGMRGQALGHPFGDGRAHTISATIVGGFNLGRILTLGRSVYFLEGGMSSPNVRTAALASTGSLVLDGLPTSPHGLPRGAVWRDDATAPSTLRIV